MSKFLELLTQRRSQYVLGSDLPLSQDETTKLIQEATRQSPSSFNSQSSRLVILYGEQHQKFWQLVKAELEKIVPAENFAPTAEKLASFAAGAGTVLFYEDQNVITGLQEQFALYADNFPIWSEHSTAMAQLAVWSVLAEANIGASLQHYNPLVDAAAAAEWQVPASWKLRAQMPFGSNQAPIGAKEFMDDSARFKVFA